MLYKKRGQVWIETVTYTMIAFVLISLVIGFARPKIEEIQDQAIIEQSIKIMENVDSIIQELSEAGEGNKRKVEITINKGEFLINAENDSLKFTIEGRFMYSQPDQSYMEGGMNVTTVENNDLYIVTFEKEYPEIDLQFGGKNETRRLVKASTAYEVFISNEGGNIINFELN